MRAVNLLPDEFRPSSGPGLPSTTSIGVAGAGVLTAAVVFLGVAFVQGHGKVSDKRETLAALQQEVAQAQAAQARTAAQQGNDRARVSAFTTASSARMPWDNLLDDVSRVLPAGSWLGSLDMQAGVPEAPGTTATTAPAGTTPTAVPTSFTVSGIAFTQDIVAKVMQRLALVPALSGVTLQSSTRTTIGTTKAYQFTMSASVRLPEVPR
jgi:Tfp pilus assembly protein PilN